MNECVRGPPARSAPRLVLGWGPRNTDTRDWEGTVSPAPCVSTESVSTRCCPLRVTVPSGDGGSGPAVRRNGESLTLGSKVLSCAKPCDLPAFEGCDKGRDPPSRLLWGAGRLSVLHVCVPRRTLSVDAEGSGAPGPKTESRCLLHRPPSYPVTSCVCQRRQAGAFTY